MHERNLEMTSRHDFKSIPVVKTAHKAHERYFIFASKACHTSLHLAAARRTRRLGSSSAAVAAAAAARRCGYTAEKGREVAATSASSAVSRTSCAVVSNRPNCPDRPT